VPEGVTLPPPQPGSDAEALQKQSVAITATILRTVPQSNAAIQLVGRSMQGVASVGVADESLAEEVVDNVQLLILQRESQFSTSQQAPQVSNAGIDQEEYDLDPGRADPAARAIQGALANLDLVASAEESTILGARRLRVQRRLQGGSSNSDPSKASAEAPVVTGAKRSLRSIGRLFVANSIPGEAPTILDLQDTNDGSAANRRLSLRRHWVRASAGASAGAGAGAGLISAPAQ